MISDPRSIPQSNEPLIALFGSLGFLLADNKLHVRLIGIGPGTFKRLVGCRRKSKRQAGRFA